MFFIRVILIGFLFPLISAVDYCKLCENKTHTLCKYKKGPAKTCVDYKKIELTPGDKKYIVDIHNDIRHHVASGHESRGTLGSQPQASDMFLVQWDDELAEIAQRWADQCIQINSSTQHDVCKKSERFEVGQNILTAVTTDTELPELSILILNWYKQVVNVIPTDIDYFMGIRRGKFLIGQYTQLVWAKTKLVGCGIAAFKENNSTSLYHHRLVCNYGPAGNVIGQAVYQRGTPCSKCPFRDCDRLRYNLCQGAPSNETDKKNNTKKIPFSKKVAETQTNNSIFSDSTSIFNTKINSSLCLNPDEFNSTTDIKYTKCITGIGTDTRNKSKLINFTETTTTATFTLISVDQGQTTLKTSLSVSIDKPMAIIHNRDEEMADDDERIIIYLQQPSSKVSYVENGVRRSGDSRHRYYPLRANRTRVPLFYNVTPGTRGEEQIVVRNKRRFIRARGTWQDGHCQCNRLYRSHSKRLGPTYFSSAFILFVYLLANIL